MEFDLIGANIVLLADKHNISIVSKEWLSQNNIINDEVINFAHLPVASVVETNEYDFFVDERNLRISSKVINKDNLGNLSSMTIKYIKKLPEIPYTALGLNYIYNVKENQKKFKEIFMINDEKLKNVFQNDYIFGGIFKFDFDEYKVNLTLQPKNADEIICDFNFHFVSSNKDEIIKILENYLKTKNKAEKVLGGLIND